MAIVPYRTGSRHSNDISSLVNVLLLGIWMFSAALFSMLRWCSRSVLAVEDRVLRYQQPTNLTMFFRSLAGVLGNSMGEQRRSSGADTFLVFVIGVFAMLTGMLFTGFIFEQMIENGSVPQMNTMSELLASKLRIRECLIDVNAHNR